MIVAHMSDDPDVESRIDTFLARYTPEIAAQLREARARLRAAFPRGVEMVYDNYNALVFGIGAGERRSDAFISVAGYPRWVTLFFLDGVALEDPAGILEGAGSQVRGVRLKSPEDMARPEVAALIAQAIARREPALRAAPPLRTVVKSVSATQRPRQPSPAVRGHDHPPAQDSREEGIRLRRARTGRPPRGAGSASDRGGSR